MSDDRNKDRIPRHVAIAIVVAKRMYPRQSGMTAKRAIQFRIDNALESNADSIYFCSTWIKLDQAERLKELV